MTKADTGKLAEQAPLAEESCSENNANYFGYEVEPLPQAQRPDF